MCYQYIPRCEYDDVLGDSAAGVLDGDCARVGIRLAAVVDETSHAACACGVDDVVLVRVRVSIRISNIGLG